MAILPQPVLFQWNDIDAASDLDRLRLVLRCIPDEELMRALEKWRNNGRDEYPVRCVWNAILAGVVFQHPSVASLRRELLRNAELRAVCGFDPLRGANAVPTQSAFSNFLGTLLEHEPLIRQMFHNLVEELRVELPDLGQFQAVDGKALPSVAKHPKRSQEETASLQSQAADGSQTSTATPSSQSPDGSTGADAKSRMDRRAEHDATWGVKTYRGKKADGTPWEKIVKWFGFQLILIVDSQHEMPIDYKVDTASASEITELLPLVDEASQHHPEIMDGCNQMAGDKGYDSTENIEGLHLRGITPVIPKRNDWKDPDLTRPVFPDRVDNVVYDVQGTVSCVCPETAEMRPMAFWGLETKRDTLKYRCPAAAFGFTCKGREACRGNDTEYGKSIRIPRSLDPRIFAPLPRNTKSFEKAYDRRTAVERVNSRIDQVLGFEQHTIRGLAKMTARVGIALIVLLSMALGRIRTGQTELMRSLVQPVERAA